MALNFSSPERELICILHISSFLSFSFHDDIVSSFSKSLTSNQKENSKDKKVQFPSFRCLF